MGDGFLGIGDGRSDGDVYLKDGIYKYSGFFTDKDATYQDALASGNTAAIKDMYKKIHGTDISDDQLKLEMNSAAANKGTDWGAIGGAVANVGGLGLGYLSYLDSHKVNKKNLKIMDQQISANDVSATRSAENYNGLRSNWGKVVTPAGSASGTKVGLV